MNKYNSLLFLFLFSWWIHLNAQTEKQIDSLEKAYETAVDISQKIEAASKLGNLYMSLDPNKASEILKAALQLSEAKNYPKGEYIINKDFAYLYNLKAKHDSAIFYAKTSLDLAQKLQDSSLYSLPYAHLAWAYSITGKYDLAEKACLRNIEISTKINDWESLSKAYFTLGNNYFERNRAPAALQAYLKVDSILGIHNPDDLTLVSNNLNIGQLLIQDEKFQNAEGYVVRAQKMAAKSKNKYQIAVVDLIHGTLKVYTEDYDEALQSLEQALSYFQEIQEDYDLGETHHQLGELYFGKEDYDKSVDHLEKSVFYHDKVGDPLGVATSKLTLGIIAKKRGENNKAIKYLEDTNAIFESTETEYLLEERVNTFQELSILYSKEKNFEKAYSYSELHAKLNDTLVRKRNSNQLNDLETKYQTEKKQQQIELLTTQNELAEQRTTNQRNLFMAGGSVLALSFIGLFFLYRNKQKTNKKLRELDSMKSNFFANISHEFRTPLTLISGPIQEKLENQKTPKKDRDAFEMIQRNNNRLLGLVDQLLDLSKIDAGKLKLRISQGNLKSILGTLVDSFSYRAQQKKVSFTSVIEDTLDKAWFDRDMVEKIILNLLSNAFKYAPEGGTVKLNARNSQNNQMVLEIINSVDGQTHANLDDFFDRFYQGDPQTEGAGIGLALVKELVSLHRGTISANLEDQNHIKFTVTLPVSRAAFNSDEIQDTPLESSASMVNTASLPDDPEDLDLEILDEKPLLLVVEDNPDVQLLLKNTFKNDFNVLEAPNGEVGIVKAVEHVPDIIISDVMMPIKDGILLTETLKKDERTSHIPIVLLTAKAGEENVLKGIESGADDYMVKPFSGKILKSKINKLVSLRKKLQERYSQEVILKPADIAINSVDEQFLNKVQKVLDSSVVESSFNTEEFSKAVGMSRMQLHRKLKALTGLSASEFIRSQRLKLAADLLHKSDINVSQVGYSVGFNDHSYFSKCFKEAYGKTPSEYAKKG